MAILSIPEKGITVKNPSEIKVFFNERNLFFDQWKCDATFNDTSTQEEILEAYSKDLNPFMSLGGYETADVISMNSLTENYDAIRTKFLAEHTHSEDEIRFFVDGQGIFWFHLENEPVFNLLCEKGDLISVPAGTKHWFDAGISHPFVKAIRIFIDMSGWVPEYTDSKLEQNFSAFFVPLQHPVDYILTDIEGTTTSIDFVYEQLFPYFRDNIQRLIELKQSNEDVKKAFEEIRKITLEEENLTLKTDEEIIGQLQKWDAADRKITQLKTVQGVLWKEGYESGELKGHIYPDVLPFLEAQKQKAIKLGVFSSGSIQAQRLLFGYSEMGDLNQLFSNNFDAITGGKRDVETYTRISSKIAIGAQNILFLSDIKEELEAATSAGMQTVQLVREGNTANWNRCVSSFEQININDVNKN
jgi:2,3-diketo-5-methylthio-1-phosphopentane phosphatase